MTEIPTTWGAAGYLAPRLTSSSRIAIARSGDALSVLFNDAQVDLDAKLDGLDGWWTTALTFATSSGANNAFRCRIMGAVNKTAVSSATLTASIGGSLTTRQYAYGTTAEERVDIELHFDKATLAAGRVMIVLAIYAERQSFDDTVMLTIDSIDCASYVPGEDTSDTERK